MNFRLRAFTRTVFIGLFCSMVGFSAWAECPGSWDVILIPTVQTGLPAYEIVQGKEYEVGAIVKEKATGICCKVVKEITSQYGYKTIKSERVQCPDNSNYCRVDYLDPKDWKFLETRNGDTVLVVRSKQNTNVCCQANIIKKCEKCSSIDSVYYSNQGIKRADCSTRKPPKPSRTDCNDITSFNDGNWEYKGYYVRDGKVYLVYQLIGKDLCCESLVDPRLELYDERGYDKLADKNWAVSTLFRKEDVRKVRCEVVNPITPVDDVAPCSFQDLRYGEWKYVRTEGDYYVIRRDSRCCKVPKATDRNSNNCHMKISKDNKTIVIDACEGKVTSCGNQNTNPCESDTHFDKTYWEYKNVSGQDYILKRIGANTCCAVTGHTDKCKVCTGVWWTNKTLGDYYQYSPARQVDCPKSPGPNPGPDPKTKDDNASTFCKDGCDDECFYEYTGDKETASYQIYFKYNSSKDPNIRCDKDKWLENIKSIYKKNKDKDIDRIIIVGGASCESADIVKNRVDFVHNTLQSVAPVSEINKLTDCADGTPNQDCSQYVGGNSKYSYQFDPKTEACKYRVVFVHVSFKDQSLKTLINSVINTRNVMADTASMWKTAEGNFNGSRLASDAIAGVVLGTAGGLITSSIVESNQLESGFENIMCTVGGQNVAQYGDEFTVGMR